ncbi:MAG: hypothetical protein ACRDZO_17990 [Egibacteraceae bacterium]
MLRAVFVRTLKSGVTYDQFRAAWAPVERTGTYPARVRVARNVADDRQVVTIVELDVPLSEFEAVRSSLTRPDALERLAGVIESTELEGLYEDVFDESAL